MNYSREQLVQQFFVNSAIIKRQAGLNYLQAAGKAGLSLSESELIFLVMRHEPLNLKSLAKMMQLSAGAITQLVESLVKQGYMNRESDPSDRRVQLLSVTENGRKKILSIRKYHHQRASEVAKILSDKELSDYLNIQNKMIAYFSEKIDKRKQKSSKEKNNLKIVRNAS